MIAALPTLASLVAVTSFGSNPGALDMYEYVPDGLAADRPIVVVLHGCSQQAADMEHAGWDALADANGFAVLYPQQRAANNALDCFDWYDSDEETRGQGEAQSIVSMVDTLLASAHGDTTKVYVTGLSAGAAYASILLATYPDRFAAGSIMSGIVYGCATDLSSATPCETMGASTQKTAAAWGDLVRAADSGFTGTWPRVQIWQGTADTTVYPANAGELVKQWTNVNGLDATPSSTTAIGSATRTDYTSASGILVEEYLVTGMGHGIAIGDDSVGTCTATTAPYFLDEQICAPLRAGIFFGVVAVPTDGPDAGAGSGSGNGGGPDGGSSGASGGAGGGCGCGAGESRSASGGIAALMIAFALVVAMRRRPT